MTTKPKYAITNDDQRKEMTVISNCWDQMSSLDTHARSRVVSWLASWVRAEAPDEDRSGMDF